MALAEGLWGGVDKYLEAANARAVELGMRDTVYRSPHGLPPDDNESFDLTTARDMSRLALACLRHPRVMAWTAVKEHAFGPAKTKHANTNKLFWRMPEADGLKTGYIRAAGFCVTATAERDGVRLVCVVMGAPTVGERFRLAQDYMERAFGRIERIQIVRAGQGVAPVDVRLGLPSQLSLQPTDDVWVTVLREDRKRLEIWAEHPRQLTGPLSAGTPVGEVQVVLDGDVLASSPLVVPTDVQARGWLLSLDNGVARWIGLDNPPITAQ
jgi:D-alanyl-D-alanine carboxypeptidase (penicillin-binding protein 5/6)